MGFTLPHANPHSSFPIILPFHIIPILLVVVIATHCKYLFYFFGVQHFKKRLRCCLLVGKCEIYLCKEQGYNMTGTAVEFYMKI